MTVMYANALYQRGFVKEGYKALYTLLEQAMNTPVSLMYPGIPEYFDADGKGKYPYLTGAASWYMMTMVTQIFGFRGEWGDLVLEPKILLRQFDESGNYSAQFPFRGQTYAVVYQNPQKERIWGLPDHGSMAGWSAVCRRNKYRHLHSVCRT